MNWEAVGAIADIFGAVAVLATLVYLALQIRQNSHSINQQNNAAQSQTLQQRADSVAQLGSLVFSNDENVAIFGKMLENKAFTPKDFSPIERTRAALMVTALRANLENAFLQYKAGYLSDEFYRDVAVPLFATYAHVLLAFDVPLPKGFRAELLRLRAREEQSDDG